MRRVRHIAPSALLAATLSRRPVMKHVVISPGDGRATVAPAGLVSRRRNSAPLAAVSLPDNCAASAALVRNLAVQLYVVDSRGGLLWSNQVTPDPFDSDAVLPARGSLLGALWSCAPGAGFAKAVTDAAKSGSARLRGSTSGSSGDRWWDIEITRIEGDPTRDGQLAVVAHDVTAPGRPDTAQARATTYEGLTGLARRDVFYERIDALSAAGSQAHFTIVMIDIDRFRQVNDEMGREIGDCVLEKFGKRLARFMRSGDVSARLGGDEFGIILCGGAARAEALVQRLRMPIRVARGRVKCSISMGFARYPEDGDSAGTLCRNAEAALYEAKSFGEGFMVRFDGNLREAEQARRAMLSRAEYALSSRSIMAYYQPKIDLQRGTVVGFEALLRWRSKAGTIELPATIWAALEEPQLSRRITEMMLDQVLADLQHWQQLGIELPVAINVSDADLRHGDFAEWLLRKLRDAGLPPSSIEVEITETVFLGRDQSHLEEMLTKLNAAHIRIALDDFGTGYASLSHLKVLPVDVIKIDRSFIARMRDDPGDRAIVEAMLAIAQRLAIEVVAEGIEHDCDMQFLRDRGCQMGQGYLFSKAITAVEVLALVKGSPISLARGAPAISA
jgi:diguanylate cyclase (GGDEF)-like protein